MVYRDAPLACVRCGAILDEADADVTATGPRCFRCGRQAEIDRHLDAPERTGLGPLVDALVGAFLRHRTRPRTHVRNVTDTGEQRIVGALRQRGGTITSPLLRHQCLGYFVTLRGDRSFSATLGQIADDVWVDDGTGSIRVDTRSTVTAPSEQEGEVLFGSPLWRRVAELLALAPEWSSPPFISQGSHGSFFVREVRVLPNEPVSITGIVTIDAHGARQIYGDVERMVHLT